MKTKPPRERAARALCRFNGVPENTMFEGRPMWESYLPEVDVILEAALSAEEWERVKQGGGE
ncbi:hypothetical protein QTA58_00115 [Neorhizobium sp. CSC1952]|uniref:hypothetical protein n=1 Tax=Neorhizobium sp. CSC1952 TaxID=2978974 RepID=UPI0025A57899|nr:hypothetical protein [Rhizobium sp. CSC1952]WJR67184.1 hypothetical protein QTA58_23895 [Rhizobium sp. CSC1952]WJR67213.1 hypothetical protein QTA58_00115 [Rhizobium sp. CSC1952]